MGVEILMHEPAGQDQVRTGNVDWYPWVPASDAYLLVTTLLVAGGTSKVGEGQVMVMVR
jgi:hypothetical protein